MFRNDSKGFSWPLGLQFTQKITWKSFLNNVKKSEIGLELGSKVEKMMSSILEVNKNLD